MEICLIWAQAQDGAIGRRNSLPWHVPEDLRRFRDLTRGCPVIMGRRTWESLPEHPLPQRTNIVLSRTAQELPGALLAPDMEAALEHGRRQGSRRVWIIGGAAVFQQAMPFADEIWVTKLNLKVVGADAFAPRLDDGQWQEVGHQVLSRSPYCVQSMLIRRRAAAA